MLPFWAAFFVGIGAFYVVTGWNREVAPVVLIIGIVLAAGLLLLDRAGRR